MFSELKLKRDLKIVEKLFFKLYKQKSIGATLEFKRSWSNDRIFRMVEKIVRAVEICTLNYVLETGKGSLNTDAFYPYWRFSADDKYRRSKYRKLSKVLTQKHARDFMSKNFKKVKIRGNIYYMVKRKELVIDKSYRVDIEEN